MEDNNLMALDRGFINTKKAQDIIGNMANGPKLVDYAGKWKERLNLSNNTVAFYCEEYDIVALVNKNITGAIKYFAIFHEYLHSTKETTRLCRVLSVPFRSSSGVRLTTQQANYLRLLQEEYVADVGAKILYKLCGGKMYCIPEISKRISKEKRQLTRLMGKTTVNELEIKAAKAVNYILGK